MQDITKNCKSVANALRFLEDNLATLTLPDFENESDNEEIPHLGKNIFIEPDIVESSETAINSVVVTVEVD